MPTRRLSTQAYPWQTASHLPPVGLAESACDAMQWWAGNASVYRNTACIATSAQSVLSCWSAHQ